LRYNRSPHPLSKRHRLFKKGDKSVWPYIIVLIGVDMKAVKRQNIKKTSRLASDIFYNTASLKK
jgi:hypothetical protein